MTPVQQEILTLAQVAPGICAQLWIVAKCVVLMDAAVFVTTPRQLHLEVLIVHGKNQPVGLVAPKICAQRFVARAGVATMVAKPFAEAMLQ